MIGLFLKRTLPLLVLILFYACAGSRPDRSYLTDQNITCNNIISAAQPWLGTPYKYGGSDYSGVDCSGFVQSIYQQVFNKDLPRTVQQMYEEGRFVRGAGLKCADLVFFNNVRGRGGMDHVGIYIGNNRFIHSSTSNGVVISDLTSDYYSKHYVSGRRY